MRREPNGGSRSWLGLRKGTSSRGIHFIRRPWGSFICSRAEEAKRRRVLRGRRGWRGIRRSGDFWRARERNVSWNMENENGDLKFEIGILKFEKRRWRI